MVLITDNLADDNSADRDDRRYQVKLQNIFEGPMDLLVHLIKKAEVDIYDIPISRITEQYLAYLEWMKQMNIDFAGDFVLMASTLTHIKSRMLLPKQLGEEEDEDPRLEITRPLLEYLRIKSAAEQLAERDLLGETTFTRKPENDLLKEVEDDQVIHIGLFELIDAFQRILEKVTPGHRVDLTRDRISVQQRITQLTEILEEKESLTFDELFSDGRERADIIVTFLALLEMAKLGLVRIAQHVPTGIIRIFYQ
ncbi:segregation and condensation protein A [Desulfosarcina ovata]|uniref:Segregation and condensation protein A n=2 Tax=Desulfosarcina ovata TaxID=83564 RepID=A0A5K8A801_9BACT|nr:segregation/condensation protein A [Desulfosarcina ovata]BBO81395.1 segregation and condensation protein A [Desulfosarcina ovata subsp. sediminis]BBO88647.1 segregation and condensation protein A [Desulfosarcina ovata subsp. ovata]